MSNYLRDFDYLTGRRLQRNPVAKTERPQHLLKPIKKSKDTLNNYSKILQKKCLQTRHLSYTSGHKPIIKKKIKRDLRHARRLTLEPQLDIFGTAQNKNPWKYGIFANGKCVQLSSKGQHKQEHIRKSSPFVNYRETITVTEHKESNLSDSAEYPNVFYNLDDYKKQIYKDKPTTTITQVPETPPNHASSFDELHHFQQASPTFDLSLSRAELNCFNTNDHENSNNQFMENSKYNFHTHSSELQMVDKWSDSRIFYEENFPTFEQSLTSDVTQNNLDISIIPKLNDNDHTIDLNFTLSTNEEKEKCESFWDGNFNAQQNNQFKLPSYDDDDISVRNEDFESYLTNSFNKPNDATFFSNFLNESNVDDTFMKKYECDGVPKWLIQDKSLCECNNKVFSKRNLSDKSFIYNPQENNQKQVCQFQWPTDEFFKNHEDSFIFPDFA